MLTAADVDTLANEVTDKLTNADDVDTFEDADVDMLADDFMDKLTYSDRDMLVNEVMDTLADDDSNLSFY